MKRLLSLLLVTMAVLMPAKLWAADGEPEPYAVLSDDSLTVTFYYDDQKAARGGMDIYTYASISPYGTATTAVIDASFADYRPTRTAFWFYGCPLLTTITGMENLNTENVTYMDRMFSGCSSLTSLDVSHFNTANVKGMGRMFDGCSSLTSLDLSNFNTANVTDMSSMFSRCSGLTSLDLSNFNTANVTNMNMMFSDCSGLTSLDLSNFNTANVTYMGGMFSGCSGMTSLDVSNFNTANVTNMDGMFSECSGLTSLDVSNFNTANVTDMWNMFYGCSGLTSLDLSNFNTANVTDMRWMFYSCSGMTTIYAGEGWNTAKVGSSSYMFYNCKSLVGGAGTVYDSSHINHTYAHIDGGTANPGYFTDKNAAPTGNAEPYAVLSDNNTVLTFYYDDQKTTRGGIDINNKFVNLEDNSPYGSATTAVFDASFANYKPTSTAYWFMDCTALTSITGMENLKTDNVTDMTRMFDECHSLISLDLSNFNTQNVTSMNMMFTSCWSLTSLDLSSLNTENVTDMDAMFLNCAGFTSLDVSGLNTNKVTTMARIFEGCSSLTSLDVSTFNTANVTNMSSMFNGCQGLTTINVSGLNTENVLYMGSMFERCENLTTLDISDFNTEKVTDMRTMFYGSSRLTTIYVGSVWSTASVGDGTSMFSSCTSLVGGAGTVFDSNHTDYTYAHIDGGTANPGYFTDKNATPAVVEPYAVLNDNNTVLTFYYDDQKEARSGMSVGPFTDYGQNGWRSLNVTKVVFDQTFANCRPTSTAFWFDGLYYLNEIEGIENLNTDNVTDMRSMFEACSSLTSIDFSHFNTENVTSFDHMFWNCTSLTNLDLSRFNTQKVTSTYWMFALCNRLTSVNLNGFNTSSMETMEGMFYDCASLAAIQAGSAAIPDSIYAQVNNPNLLVYVNEASLAPSNVQNVVVNGTAREIVLTDATSGNNNFYVPQAFTAERISYTRNFAQSTQVGVSRGWESIALPFDVQTITHETKGTIAPFGNTASNRHFWLRELGSNGLQPATGIAANTPYVISMPNSSDYTDSYNLAGRVTFAAENTQVPVTEVKASAMADESIVMIPTMQRQDRSSAVWALNVGEVRGRYLEGSVFERDYREVRPFEAYTVHREENSQPAPRYVPLQEIGGTTGIHSVESGELSTEKWYDLNGRQLQGKPTKKGVYINNGQKIVVR